MSRAPVLRAGRGDVGSAQPVRGRERRGSRSGGRTGDHGYGPPGKSPVRTVPGVLDNNEPVVCAPPPGLALLHPRESSLSPLSYLRGFRAPVRDARACFCVCALLLSHGRRQGAESSLELGIFIYFRSLQFICGCLPLATVRCSFLAPLSLSLSDERPLSLICRPP